MSWSSDIFVRITFEVNVGTDLNFSAQIAFTVIMAVSRGALLTLTFIASCSDRIGSSV